MSDEPQTDEEAIALVYAEDSVLTRLKETLEAATAESSKQRDIVHQLEADKRRARRALDQALGLLNRSKRRIKTRERILVDRFMQDKVIRLRRKLGITPKSV